MNHATARAVFEEIRARPYSVSVGNGEACNNCYYKNVELMQRLEGLGYKVRSLIGETGWELGGIPAEVVAGWPEDIEVTHYWIEVEVDGAWRALDASFQPGLAARGLMVCDWEAGGTCFPITKAYSDEERAVFERAWATDAAKVADYFKRSGPVLRQLNAWFAIK